MLERSSELIALLGSDTLRYERGFRHRCIGFCQLHRHAAMELVLHLDGTGEEWGADGQAIAFAAGAVSLHPTGVLHGQRMGKIGEDVCIHVQAPARLPPGLERSLIGLPLNDLLVQQQFFALTQPVAGGALELATRHHLTRALVARILEHASDSAPMHDPVDRAQLYLREHYREIGSLDEVASGLGIGPDHLRHLFRRRTGRSLLEYLTSIRVGRACDLLEHSALPVAEIAHQCGYASHRHLDVVFRRAKGCTPRRYRVQVQEQRRTGR